MNPTWTARRLRDLTIMTAPGGQLIVIACDSVGGIGPKPHDTFRTEARTVTHFAARVPLLEVIACGAQPAVIVDTLSVEKDPAGAPMIDEIRRLAAELGLDPETAVTGSTEDNVDTVTTALGVTVIGYAEPGDLNAGTTQPRDQILAVGLPLSAPTVKLVPGDPRMPSLAEISHLLQIPGVHDVLPVGSHGIAYEIDQLVVTAGLTATPAGPGRVDRSGTAGPSSCVIVSATPAAATRIASLRDDLPVELVAVAHPDTSTSTQTRKALT